MFKNDIMAGFDELVASFQEQLLATPKSQKSDYIRDSKVHNTPTFEILTLDEVLKYTLPRGKIFHLTEITSTINKLKHHETRGGMLVTTITFGNPESDLDKIKVKFFGKDDASKAALQQFAVGKTITIKGAIIFDNYSQRNIINVREYKY